VGIEAVEHDATVYPLVSGEQYEVAPPLYLPHQYIGKPIQRPIYDPPRAFGGDPGDPSNPPPPADPPQQPSPITAWYKPAPLTSTWYYSQYPATYETSPMLRNPAYATGTPGDELSKVFLRAGVTYWAREGWIVPYACDYLQLTGFHRPLNPNITHIRFRIYKEDQLRTDKLIPWTFDPVNDVASPQEVYMPLNGAFEYSIMYYDDVSDISYEIGGNVDWTGFTSHRYRLRGEIKESSSIEGYINYLKDTNTNIISSGGGADFTG
jgi:hypothetical protein